ncbi:hypothetical protein HELRODRAFT_169115 [Helobdella robusta]|uniref:Uncharacterized protein n=1 Tax=Helobdella robusta TaxID=6412 RepID=T1F1F1_HELRO|nr:hypothetical protein HELRODRAFT_169115 [Helobdella robusta]ESO08309.1 hypothetical protein HELRODRAFT_169115 [Helobdella robusta]
MTVDAFVASTKFNIAAAGVLLLALSQDPLEKFFSKARQRNIFKMLSLTRDLIKKSGDQHRPNEEHQLKPLTICYWSEFINNPSIMYGLFSSNSRKLTYNSDKVMVIGTKEGMIK